MAFRGERRQGAPQQSRCCDAVPPQRSASSSPQPPPSPSPLHPLTTTMRTLQCRRLRNAFHCILMTVVCCTCYILHFSSTSHHFPAFAPLSSTIATQQQRVEGGVSSSLGTRLHPVAGLGAFVGGAEALVVGTTGGLPSILHSKTTRLASYGSGVPSFAMPHTAAFVSVNTPPLPAPISTRRDLVNVFRLPTTSAGGGGLTTSATAKRGAALGIASRPSSSALSRNAAGAATAVPAAATDSSSFSSHLLEGRLIRGPLEPLGNGVLVRLKKAAEKSDGGLLLTDEHKKRASPRRSGEVVAVGRGETNQQTGRSIPMPLEVGDWILFGANSGDALKYDAEDCVLISADEVEAKIASVGGELSSPLSISPLNDYVLLKVQPREEVTEGGLILPADEAAAASHHHRRGEVVAVGDGAESPVSGVRMKPQVASGDEVLFTHWGEDDRGLRFGNDSYLIIPQRNIMAKW